MDVGVRSKSNTKRADSHQSELKPDPELPLMHTHTQLNPYLSLGSEDAPLFDRRAGLDFVLFGDDGETSILGEEDEEKFDGVSPDGTQILLTPELPNDAVTQDVNFPGAI